MNKKLKKYLNISLRIGMLILLVAIFEYWGLGFIIVYYIVYSFYALYKGWDHVMMLKQQTEAVIWGKPLHLFTKDELKNTKVKIKWRKEKMDITVLPNTELESIASKSRIYYMGLLYVGLFCFVLYIWLQQFFFVAFGFVLLFGALINYIDMYVAVLRLEVRTHDIPRQSTSSKKHKESNTACN